MVWAVRTSGEGPSVAWWAIGGTLLVKMELGRSGGENLLHNLLDSDRLGEQRFSQPCVCFSNARQQFTAIGFLKTGCL